MKHKPKLHKYHNEILEICRDLLLLQYGKKYTVFISFSGHIDEFSFYIYRGKWGPRKKRIMQFQYKESRGWEEGGEYPYLKSSFEEVNERLTQL